MKDDTKIYCYNSQFASYATLCLRVGRTTALLSGLLLLTFGGAMTLALGVKAPLNYAVLTGVGGALLLANFNRFPFSVDELLFRRTLNGSQGIDRCNQKEA
jgi:hypothetical protein